MVVFTRPRGVDADPERFWLFTLLSEGTSLDCARPPTHFRHGEPDVAMNADVTADADAAVDTDAPAAAPSSSLLWGNLDLIFVVALVPVALSLGAPTLGLLLGAGGWILQRLVMAFDRRLIRKATDPVKQVAANLAEAFARIWLLAGVIVLSSVAGERSDGLTASVVIFAAYSVAFVVRLVSGPPARRKADA
jgi:hypothetical protein